MNYRNDRPLIASATCMGIGLGGFVDGILFHQILQSHNMLSHVVPKINLVNMEINMFWDGIFHAFCFIMTLVGFGLFLRAIQRKEVIWSSRMIIGSMLMGWGIFNLVEGIIDHFIFQLHHAVETLGLSAFDWGFLASGVFFIAIGRHWIRTHQSQLNVIHSVEEKAA